MQLKRDCGRYQKEVKMSDDNILNWKTYEKLLDERNELEDKLASAVACINQMQNKISPWMRGNSTFKRV